MEVTELDAELIEAAPAPAPQQKQRVRISSGHVAVDQDYYWIAIDSSTPRGVKVQLLGQGGVAVYGMWDGKNPFWSHWAPLPKVRS